MPNKLKRTTLSSMSMSYPKVTWHPRYLKWFICSRQVLFMHIFECFRFFPLNAIIQVFDPDIAQLYFTAIVLRRYTKKAGKFLNVVSQKYTKSVHLYGSSEYFKRRHVVKFNTASIYPMTAWFKLISPIEMN